jgi:predicted kinase
LNVSDSGSALDAALPRGAGRILVSTAGRGGHRHRGCCRQCRTHWPRAASRPQSGGLHLVSERKKYRWADDDPMPHLADGRTVLAVTQDPALLRPALRAAADLVVTAASLNATMVRKVINAVTGGRSRGPDDADIAGHDFEQVAAAIRQGSTAMECVQRLKRLQSLTASIADSAPDLAMLPLFGKAKDWAADTVLDIERLKRGEIAAADLEHVLLYGPPGTGKTVLARAVAKAANVQFFDTSIAEWFTCSDGHLDGVLKQASAFFQTLMDSAPAVGLLDEAEALPYRSRIDSRHRE